MTSLSARLSDELDHAYQHDREQKREISRLERELAASTAEVERLRLLLNTPEVADFLAGAVREAGHQRERWGDRHDAGKAPPDWHWTLGWLSGKAVTAATLGDRDKLKHHLITSAALLANWHRHVTAEEGPT